MTLRPRPFAPHLTLWAGVLALVALGWIWSAPYFNNLNNPNENVRVYMTRAIVEHHTFAIDPIVAEWGYVNDKATHDGHLYPGKAPGTSFLAVPGYALYHAMNQLLQRTPYKGEAVWACRVSASILPVLGFLLAFAAFTRRLTDDNGVRTLGVVALALGSTMLPYGVLAVSHASMAASLFGAVIVAYRHFEEPESPWWPLLAGLLLGTAVMLEYPAALGGVVVAVWGLWRSRARLAWAGWGVAGAAFPLLLLAFFHWRCFGSPFQTAYQHLENPEFVEHVSGGFFGMERVSLRAFVGSFFIPSNGLFWFVPWTIPVVCGLPLAVRVRELREPAAVTAAVLLVYAVFISMVKNWQGGWSAGPRYIVPVIPFLAWYFVHLLAWAQRTWAAGWSFVGAAGLVGAAIFNCATAAAVFPHFSPDVVNPIVEIALYMPAHGYTPYSVGWLLGAPGIAGIAPLAALVVSPWLWSTIQWAGDYGRSRVTVLLLSVLGSGSLLLAQSLPRTRDGSVLERERAFVAEIWEPARDPLDIALRTGNLPDDLRGLTVSSDALERAASHAAALGYSETALSFWVEARRAREREARARVTTGDLGLAPDTGAPQGSGEGSAP